MSADDLLLTSTEAKILRKKMEDVADTCIGGLQAVQGGIRDLQTGMQDLSGTVGEVIGDLQLIKEHVGLVPAGYQNGVQPPKVERGKGLPPGTFLSGLQIGDKPRPSVPPKFEKLKGIIATSTGRFRVDDEFLSSVATKLDALETENQRAAAEAEGMRKLKELWEGRFKLAILIGGAVVGFGTAIWGFWQWAGAHVH